MHVWLGGQLWSCIHVYPVHVAMHTGLLASRACEVHVHGWLAVTVERWMVVAVKCRLPLLVHESVVMDAAKTPFFLRIAST